MIGAMRCCQMRMAARNESKSMAIPLDETSDKADAALGSNPKGTSHVAPTAALLAPDWE